MASGGGLPRAEAEDKNPIATDLQHVLDAQRIGRTQIVIIATIFLLAAADGVDLQVSSFAATDLARDWGIARADLAPFLSAGLVGLLFGSPALGWLGDRAGRKRAALVSCGAIAGASVLCALAQSLPALIAARVLAGFFIGGLMPNLVALAVELAPARWRGLYVVLAAAGVGLGATATAWLMTLVPALHGWRNLFLFSAAAPVLGGIVATILLPESPVLLIRHARHAPALRRLLERLRPEIAVGPLPLSSGRPSATTSRALFEGDLAWLTPTLWLLAGLVFLTSYLITSWTPVLMSGAGLSDADAGRAVSLLHTGGTLGAAVVATLVDRWGWAAIGGAIVLAMAGAASLPMADAALLPWLMGVLGFGVIGAQCGLNAAAGLSYSATVRARGTGFVFAASRIGSVGGPFLGGALLARGMTGPALYQVALIPLAAALVTLLLVVAARGRALDPSRTSPRLA